MRREAGDLKSDEEKEEGLMEEQVCSGPLCKDAISKPWSAFDPDLSRKPPVAAWCRDCVRFAARPKQATGDSKKEEGKIMGALKLCKKCGQEKERNQFGKWQQVCLACQGPKAGTTVALPRSAAPAKKKTPRVTARPAGSATKKAPQPAAAQRQDDLLVKHSERCMRIALRGPGPEDGPFVPSVFAGLITDTLESSVLPLEALAVS